MTDQGQQTRMGILEESAQRNILDVLAAHGWTATIISRQPDGDGYLIVEATRASAKHRVALLYSSASSNATYKLLDSQVEAIFTNGALYMVEQFAYGIRAPVQPVNDFFANCVVAWNDAVSPGKVAIDL